ncbi:hypothetical protein [Pseudobutyrivibrio xylanivorans]|uniref:DUF2721 domain-containing protein n=1 Tax=Pseudobutyrivibrio xylanivorans TaxID=185007 RepID=A0A5P6VM41_PSEXY|nr:hypothetical protein [Pseudobutyrivibrio xylanivorans]QFJ53627.1 DUF2721 domain-containing protein [Pseudobutyrivibrio xylanivorans]
MTQSRPGGTSGMRSRNNARPRSSSVNQRPRQGVASRELQEARRKRRQREVMRNRIIFGTVCVALFALVVFLIVKLAGMFVGSGTMADTSTLTVEKDGQIVFEEVADFDAETYSKADLKTYTKDLIASFNDTYGSKAITLDRFRVTADKAYIKTTYVDADAYSAFTSYQTFNGTYEEAAAAGYDFEELFCITENDTKGIGTTVDASETFPGFHVAIVNENVTVKVPGQIYYISEPSTEMVDANTVSIKQADGNEDVTDTVYILYTPDK